MIKFLAIDDNPDNLIILKALIKETFPEALLFTAHNGKTGIELAIAENPDVILLDIVMPEMDGYEVCHRLKNNNQLSDIPVIFITALKGDRKSRILALEAGAEAFLAKPVDDIELTAQLRAMLKIREANLKKRDEKAWLEVQIINRTKELENELEERMRAEKALHENEELMSALLNGIPESAFLIESDGTVIAANSTVAKRLNCSLEQLIDNNIYNYISGEVADFREKYLKKVLETKQPVQFEDERFGRIIDNRIHPVFDNDGNVQRLAIIGIDVTDRRSAENLLRESEEKFRTLVNQMQPGLALHELITDENGTPVDYRFLDINPNYEKITGLHRELVIGKTVLEVLPELEKYWIETYANVVLTGEPVTFENYSAELGKYFSVVAYKHKTNEFVVVVEDITNRKESENTLKNSELLFRTLFEEAPVGYHEIDSEGRIVRVNSTELQILGYSEEEMTGHFVTEFVHNPTHIIDDLRKKLHGEFSTEGEFERNYIRKDGSVIQVAISDKLIFDSNGIITGIRSSVMDITERKLAEQAIRKASENWNRTFNSINSGIILLDSNQKIIQSNQAFQEFLGRTEYELLGQHCFNCVHGTECPIDSCPFVRMKLSQQRETMELLLNGKDCEIIVDPILNDAGELTGAVHIINDITQRKLDEKFQKILFEIIRTSVTADKLEDLLHIIRRELNEVIDTTNFFVALHIPGKDTLRKVIFKDEKDDFLEWSVEDSFSGQVVKLGKTLLFNKEEAKRFAAKQNLKYMGSQAESWLGVPLLKGQKAIGVIVVQNYNQSNAYDKKSILLLEMVAHELSLVIERNGMIKDLVNARDKAEENEKNIQQKNQELSERNIFIQTVLDNLPIGLSLNNSDEGAATYMNKKFEEIYGWPASEITSIVSFFEKVYPDADYRQKIIERIMADINSGDKEKMHWENIEITGENGTKKIVNAVNIPLPEQKTMISTVMDITELYEIQKQLISAKEKAEESDRLKSAFLANMSHEIRTPMNGILGFAGLLNEPNLTNEEKNEFISIIQTSGERMLNTLNDLIDISKIETGQMNLINSETDIKLQILNLYSFFEFQAKEKNLGFTLKNNIADEFAIIETDITKFDSILSNLIKNAIKYTDNGTIEIGCSSNHQNLDFYVRDTGIGIPKHRQSAVFNRFEQADIGDTRAFQGSGLGLTIAKAYTEMLGGKIWLESEVGVGSTFYVSIPLLKGNKESWHEKITEIADHKIKAVKKIKIIIAEDDENGFFYLEAILKSLNCEIIRCFNGIEAVGACRSNPDADVVLMDIKMPLLNGYDAARNIREFNNNIIIIAQTAFALSGDKERAINAGCNDYISKPIRRNDLLTLIKKHLKKGVKNN
jgi:PAS domain S-box-containing protein